MNSDKFFERLNEVWDRRESPEGDEQLQAASREEPELRELLAASGALSEGLRHAPVPAPPPDLADRVLAGLNADSPQPAVRRVRTWVANSLPWVGVAAAAAVIAAVSWGMFVPHTPNDGKSPAVANTDLPDAPDAANPPQSGPRPQVDIGEVPRAEREPSVEQLLREASDRYLSMADETSETFSEVAVLLPDVPQRNAGPPAADSTWIKNVGDGFQPITGPVSNTLNLLFSAPPAKESSKL